MEEALIKEIQKTIKGSFEYSKIQGGSICQAYKLEVEDGRVLFCKFAPEPTQMFKCELSGLLELKKGKIRVPLVLVANDKYIIMEFINSGVTGNQTFLDFGKKLANIHKIKGELFGFREDNYIGSNIQINKKKSSWLNFYYENRLLFQFKLAESNNLIDRETARCFSLLEKKLHKIISDDESPSLIHGDLWSGNIIVDENSNICLIDPAVYFGHREAEFGMITLFGGFNNEFFDGYNEAYPLKEGWRVRNKIYQLYHLLNHLNLFGKNYLNKVTDSIKFYL